jgi:hypothetical protein
MPLLEFQSAMGHLVRSPNGEDPLRSLSLVDDELSCIEALKRSAGYHFTVGVQRSWCIDRAWRAGYLTLSILQPELRHHVLDEWANSGGGTSSFVAAEADRLLEFIANLLPDPSHELSACCLEQASIRANAGTVVFEAPDTTRLDRRESVLQRSCFGGIATFHGEPDLIMTALLNREECPPILSTIENVLLFGPGLERLCRPASSAEVALWKRLDNTLDLTLVLAEGHRRSVIEAMICAGALEIRMKI